MSNLSPLLSQPADCLCSRLQLKLTPARLDLLFNAMRSDEKALTDLGLQVVDRMIYDYITPPSSGVLDAFQTTDESMARIFSDMISQSKDVRGKAIRPTLMGVGKVQALSLSRRGILSPSKDTPQLISRRDYPLLPWRGLTPRSLLSLPNTPWLLADVRYAPAAVPRRVKPGHVCSLIQLPDEAAQERLADLLTQRRVQSYIRRIHALGSSDYLDIILDTNLGCEVDFLALSLTTGRSLEELLPALPSGYAVWTTKRDAVRLSKLLENIGCTMTPFIRAKRRADVTLDYRHETIFACRLSALRGVLTPPAVDLRLPSPCVLATSIAPPTLVRNGSFVAACTHLPADGIIRPDALSEHLTEARRMLAEAGGRTDRCYLSVGICENAQTPHSGLWSAALSLYQARNDAELAAHDTQIHLTENGPGGTTVCLIAPLA